MKTTTSSAKPIRPRSAAHGAVRRSKPLYRSSSAELRAPALGRKPPGRKTV